MNLTMNREPLSVSIRQWEVAFDDARDLDTYLANWDGEGADPVPLALIETTLRLLEIWKSQDHPAPADIYPLADGTVMVEFHYVSGVVDSANIRTGGRIEIVRRELGTKPTFTVIHLSDLADDAGDASPSNPPLFISDEFTFSLAT